MPLDELRRQVPVGGEHVQLDLNAEAHFADLPAIHLVVGQIAEARNEQTAVFESERDAVDFPERLGAIVVGAEAQATHLDGESIAVGITSGIGVFRRAVRRRAAGRNGVASAKSDTDSAAEREVRSAAGFLHPAHVDDDQSEDIADDELHTFRKAEPVDRRMPEGIADVPQDQGQGLAGQRPQLEQTVGSASGRLAL